MSSQITEAFVQQYSNNVQMLSQQKGSLLRGVVDVESVNGKHAYFERIGQVSAQKRVSRHSDTPQIDTPHSRRRISMADYEWADLIDQQDRVRTLIDPTSQYALAAAYGIGSEHDDDAVALTQPPAKEKGTDRTHTKAKQKLEPVSEQAKKNPPITTEARNLITDQLKQLMETNPDKAKEIAAAFITEFKVPRVTGFITEARHGEFLSHAISKIADD